MDHDLKINFEYLENLKSGRKKAEVRLNDRDYQVGDTIDFFDSLLLKHHRFRITHIHSGLGLKEGFVVLSVEKEKPFEGGGNGILSERVSR